MFLLILLIFTSPKIMTAQEIATPKDDMNKDQWEEVVSRAEKRLEELESKKTSAIPRKKNRASSQAAADNKNNSPIIFTEEPTVQILTGDQAAGFDQTDDPGYDTSDVNDRVRSYDRIFYSFKLSLGSNDGQDYEDIKIKISGDIEGAYSPRTGNINASVPASYGGTVDRENKKNGFVFNYDKTGSAGIKTGSIQQFTIPVTIFGARNGTEVSLKNFKITLLSAKKADGTETKLDQEIAIKGMKTTTVSSKPNLTVKLDKSWSDPYLPYDYLTKKEEPYNIRQLGVGITLAELTDRVLSEAYKKENRLNRFLGVEVPEDKIEVIFGQEASLLEPGQHTKDLMIDSGFEKTTVYDYGDVGATRYPDHFKHGYLNELRNSLYMARSRGMWDETSVFDSGKQTITNEIDSQTKVTFENYKVDPYSVPIRPQASNKGSQVFYNFYFFATVGAYLKEDIRYLNAKNSIKYRMKVLSLKIADENETVITIPYEVSFNRESVLHGPSQVVTYSKYLDTNRAPTLDNNNNDVSPTGKGIISGGSEFIARTSIENGTDFWGEESILLQKWNPEASTFMSADFGKGVAFYPGEVLEAKSLQYGVSRQKKYDNVTLSKNRLEAYEWFSNPEEAKKVGEISAVQSGSYGKRKGNTYERLNVRRRLKENVLGATTPQGDSIVNISWGKVYRYRGDESNFGEEPAPNKIYTPTKYTEDGTIMNHSSIHGDTLLVLPAQVTIKQALNSNDVFVFKSSDKVSTTLTTEMKNSNPDSTYEGELTIKSQLPKGMYYSDGSAKYGSATLAPEIKPLANGETLLTWRIKHKVNQPMPKLTFDSTFVQSDLSFKADGLVDLQLTSTIEHQGINADIGLRRAVSKFSVMREDKWEIDYKVEPLKLLPGSNQDVSLNLKVSNQLKDPLNNVNLLNVLPQDKDDLGSKLAGEYQVTGLTVLKNDQKTPDAQAKVYYTDQVVDRKKNPNSIASDLSGWTNYTNQKIQPKALFIQLPKIEPSQSSYITIHLKLATTEPGDKMRNVITGNSPFFEGQVMSQVREVNWDYPKVTMKLNRKLKNKENNLEPLYDLKNPDQEITEHVETVKRKKGETFADFLKAYTEDNLPGYDYQGYRVKVGAKTYENNLDQVPIEDFEVTLLYKGQLQMKVAKQLTFEAQHVPKTDKVGIPLKKETTAPEISVTNTQGMTSHWQLSVKEETKLTGKKELLGELVYRKSKAAPNQPLSKESLPIISSEESSKIITTVDLLTPENEGKGLFLNLKTGNLAGDYQGKLI